MIWIGAVLGLRWSEVAALRVGRLRFGQSRLTVAEGLTRGVGGRNLFGSPKSRAGSRTMSVPHAIVEMLQAHLVSIGLAEDDSNALLFRDDAGRPLRYSNCRRRVWLPAVKAAMRRSGFSRPPATQCNLARRRRRRRQDGAGATRSFGSSDDTGGLRIGSGIRRPGRSRCARRDVLRQLDRMMSGPNRTGSVCFAPNAVALSKRPAAHGA
jgi:hypothetical protein